MVNPKEWLDIAVDVYFDGVDTSKLILPNAEQMASDPMEREKMRQMMLVVAQNSQLQQMIAAIQPQKPQAGQPPAMAGGSPQPGAPEALPQAPGGAPPPPKGM